MPGVRLGPGELGTDDAPSPIKDDVRCCELALAAGRRASSHKTFDWVRLRGGIRLR
jgi:hypothetical protein